MVIRLQSHFSISRSQGQVWLYQRLLKSESTLDQSVVDDGDDNVIAVLCGALLNALSYVCRAESISGMIIDKRSWYEAAPNLEVNGFSKFNHLKRVDDRGCGQPALSGPSIGAMSSDEISFLVRLLSISRISSHIARYNSDHISTAA
jgi:hypothetical protein